MNACPTEFGKISNVRFHAFGGATPTTLAKELTLMKSIVRIEQSDIAVLFCMLNGLAKYSKQLQWEPTGYRQSF